MNASGGRALVIPAAFDAPLRVIDWPYPPHTDRRTLDVLYAEIGCDCIDATPAVPTPLGTLLGWSDDVSLLKDQPEYNDRAIALFRHFGYQVPALAGNIVLTGGADPVGDTLPLPPALIDWLHAVFAHVADDIQVTEQENRS
jgi:hypothetical protein